MIKIAHEAPLSIMGRVRENTDYCYALVHLFETHPEYLKFFKQSIELGRTVILDNSIFELGEAFDTEKYVGWIKELKPTEYIIPDVLENPVATVDRAKQWMEKYSDLPGKKIAVVQGTDLKEVVYCYKNFLELGVDKIAFTFRGKLYERQSLGLVEPLDDRIRLMSWSLGRVKLLDRLMELNIIDKKIPHHLLGCSLPQEFLQYTDKKYSWIESLDTSNPVLLGLDYQRYDEKGGVSYKAESLLFERIDEPVAPLSSDIIYENILSFRELLKKK